MLGSRSHGSLRSQYRSHETLRSHVSHNEYDALADEPIELAGGAGAGGVYDMESISYTWSFTSIVVAWCSIELISVVTALANQTLNVYTNYATASFNRQSLLATLQVVYGVLNVVTRPPLAKLADVIGRFEGFLFSIVLTTVGFILLAQSPNIEAYFLGQVFYTVGSIGIQFMIQIFAADTTDMVHRAIFIILPNIWYLVVPWIGGPLTTAVLNSSGWRWGIGMWALILPVCSLPLLGVLFYHKVAAHRFQLTTNCAGGGGGGGSASASVPSLSSSLSGGSLFSELDVIGTALLAVGLSLLFIAVPLAAGEEEAIGISSPISIGAMAAAAIVCLIAFPLYEVYVASYPLLDFGSFKQSIDIPKAYFFIFIYNLAFYIYNTYFFSWLIVVFDLSNTAATNVSVVNTVGMTAAGALSAVAVKYTRTVRPLIVAGSAIALIGVSLIYHFREPGSTAAQLVTAQAIDGIGSGILGAPNQVLVQAYADHTQVAMLTAWYLSSMAAGQVVGDGISGYVYKRGYYHHLTENLPSLNRTQVDRIINDMNYAVSFPVGSAIRDGIIASYNGVMRSLLFPPMVLFATMVFVAYSYDHLQLDAIPTRGRVVGHFDTDRDHNYEPVDGVDHHDHQS